MPTKRGTRTAKSESARETAPRRVFVIWDTRIRELRAVVGRVRKQPPPGCEIDVAAVDSASEHIWGRVKAGIDAADLVIAYCDFANVNVGAEIGYALGKGKELRFVSYAKTRPAWTRRHPFKSVAVPPCRTTEALRAEIVAVPTLPIVGGRISVATEGRARCVVPESGVGDVALDVLREQGWTNRDFVTESSKWALQNLGAALGTAPIVVLVLEPPDLDEVTDGYHNASFAILAGAALAASRTVQVWKHRGFERDLVDLEWIEDSWESEGELESLVLALAERATGGEPDPVEAYRRYLGTDDAHLRPRVPFFDRLIESARGEVYVELEIGDGAERPSPEDPRFRALRATSLRALLELPDEGAAEGPSSPKEAPRVLKGRAKAARRGRKAADGARTSDAGTAITGRWHLLGDPGAGKSTVCRHLALEVAREKGGRIPIFVPLPGWDAFPGDPIEFVVDRFGRVKGKAAAATLDPALRAALSSTPERFWFLFDSFDEVTSERASELRDRLLHWVAEQDPRIRVVVTSRRTGAPEFGRPFLRASLLPLPAPDREKLLVGWLGSELGSRVVGDLRARPVLFDLVANPLMLTLVAGVVRESAKEGTPKTRREIYERAIRTLLERGLAATPCGVPEWRTARAFLELLALRLQEQGTWSYSEELVAKTFRKLLRGRDEAKALEEQGFSPKDIQEIYRGPDAFLRLVAERSGLLGDLDGPGLPWLFMHRSLQEYLSACALDRLGSAAVARRIKAVGTDDEAIRFWAETLGHYCGLPRPEAELRATFEALVAAKGNDENRADLALRTLPNIEGLSPKTTLALLHSCPGWDGDDLLAVLRSLVAEGHAAKDLLDHLWPSVTPTASTEELAWIYYACEGAELIGDPALFRRRFFAACGRALPSPEDQPNFVLIPAGRFLMGSPDDEKDREDDEETQHEVEVGSFRLGATPITQAGYALFDSAEERRADPASRDLPVVNVSWWDAWLFCRWLDAAARLPTEAEWEYACRAGTRTRFWSGDDDSDLAEVGWFNGNSEIRLHPVGEKKRPNPFGLHDMHGNVDEWVADWFGDYPDDVRRQRNPAGPESGSDRVIRGGSFGSVARWCRSAYRDWLGPGVRGNILGFRVALPPPSR